MLSTIGRAAVRRVVAPGPQSTNNAFRSVWHLQYVGTFHHPKGSSALPKSSFPLVRTYATATKVSPKPKTTTAQKAKPKKAAAKKPVKKLAKKKNVLKKLVKKVVKKKVLTEEEKKKAVVKALKAKALSIPKKLPQSAWTVLTSEHSRVNPGSMASGGMVEVAGKYKNLSPAELEHYNHLANQNKAANEVAFKQWVESHTPEQIRLANNARHQLRLKDPNHTWRAIQDDRSPKRPTTAMFFFVKDRYASGDMKGIKLGDNARLLSKEWAALSPSDRKTYENQAAADKQRYIQEYKTVYHRDPLFVTNAKTT